MKKIIYLLLLISLSMPVFADSIAEYTQAINSAPKGSYEQAEKYAYRATEYLINNNFSMAISDATKAIQIGYDKDKYEFVEWALRVYYTRGFAYFSTQNYSAAMSDFTQYINNSDYVVKYMDSPSLKLLLGNSYYLRALAKVKSKSLSSHNDTLKVFSDLEAAIKIYSDLDLPQAAQKKEQAVSLLKNMKAAYYK